jgi:hypothetical protein
MLYRQKALDDICQKVDYIKKTIEDLQKHSKFLGGISKLSRIFFRWKETFVNCTQGSFKKATCYIKALGENS